jgi:hypothetical protein
MLAFRVGLADTTGTIAPRLMAAAAAALNVQVIRDLPRFWPIRASVAWLPDPRDVPQGVWPILIVHGLGQAEGGAQLGRNNQPFAKVADTPGGDEWTLEASHQICQMLVDPAGNALQTGAAVDLWHGDVVEAEGRVEYLVEACAPCASCECSYEIDGVMVSDFITPRYFDTVLMDGVRYSFTGAVRTPRRILPGGRLTWLDPRTEELRQIIHADLDRPPELRNLGASEGPSLRRLVDSRTHLMVRANRPAPSEPGRLARRIHRDRLVQTGDVRAGWFR